jgi:hypothetical protein
VHAAFAFAAMSWQLTHLHDRNTLNTRISHDVWQTSCTVLPRRR